MIPLIDWKSYSRTKRQENMLPRNVVDGTLQKILSLYKRAPVLFAAICRLLLSLCVLLAKTAPYLAPLQSTLGSEVSLHFRANRD